MTATILQFPKRNKGRVRKTESIRTMGECALRRTSRRPENVEVLADHRENEHDHGHLALMLASSMFATLPKTRKAKMANALRGIALHDQRARAIVGILGI